MQRLQELQENSLVDKTENREGKTHKSAPNTPSRLRARARGLVVITEKAVEAALSRAVEKADGACWKFVSPGTAGVPDRIVILPGGHVGFVEVKAPGERPRALQLRRIARLKALGCSVFVIDHPDQVRGVLDAIRTA